MTILHLYLMPCNGYIFVMPDNILCCWCLTHVCREYVHYELAIVRDSALRLQKLEKCRRIWGKSILLAVPRDIAVLQYLLFRKLWCRVYCQLLSVIRCNGGEGCVGNWGGRVMNNILYWAMGINVYLLYSVFLFLPDREAPAQRSVRRSASFVFYAASQDV
jgi:hypothetical protein